MEEPLKGEETSHRDNEDNLAEWVHGHPTPLSEKEEKRVKVTKGIGYTKERNSKQDKDSC